MNPQNDDRHSSYSLHSFSLQACLPQTIRGEDFHEQGLSGPIMDPHQNLRRSLLSAERIRELSRLTYLRPIADTGWCWLWIVLAWILVAFQSQPWAVLIAVPVIGSRYYALTIIGHDGLHRRIFKSQFANDLFADLFIFGPIGAITRLNNKNHLSHHRHLATENDPDRHKHACFNKALRYQLLGYLTGVTSVLRSMTNIFAPPKEGIATIASNAPQPIRDGYRWRDFAILLCWQALLIGGLTFGIGWWAYPLLWLLPVYTFSFLADNMRSFLEHSHIESDDLADKHRLITYESNSIERLFLAPMNMNYHAAHHLWPSIPYYNLPLANREIRGNPAAREITWRGSYLAYLWRYYFALPIIECIKRAKNSV